MASDKLYNIDPLKEFGDFVTVTGKEIEIITKTCLYNFDPLKPQLYIVNWG